MTPRERLLTAIRNQQPDRVPVAPDISNMIPTRLTGKGYHAVYAHEDPPLWKAYLDAVKFYGIDGWFIYGNISFVTRDVTTSEKWLEQSSERMVKEITFHTPQGEITQQILYPSDKPPIIVKKYIENIERDWPRFKYLLGEILYADDKLISIQRKELGERGVLGCGMATPGFHIWNDYFEGGLITLCDLLIEYPQILDELYELHNRRLLEELKYILKAQPDFVLTGGSGSITLASPKLWLKYAFPNLKEQCLQCKENGVLSMVHSCGKEKFLVETCARETELNCINPLEIPPMGDMELAEAKQIVRNSQLSLMGNLHTTDVMLLGTAEEVKTAARKAIEDAGAGGGFILSTGDQCSPLTPDANLFAMVEAAEEYGKYS